MASQTSCFFSTLKKFDHKAALGGWDILSAAVRYSPVQPPPVRFTTVPLLTVALCADRIVEHGKVLNTAFDTVLLM